MALIVNINIASPAPLTVSPERDDGLISPLNGCNGVMVKGMVSGYAPILLLASSWCQEGAGCQVTCPLHWSLPGHTLCSLLATQRVIMLQWLPHTTCDASTKQLFLSTVLLLSAKLN